MCKQYLVGEEILVSEFLEIAKNPGIIAIASGLIAVATYSFQEHQKRRANQYKNMGALYENIISDLFRLFFVENGKERSALLKVIEKAWLYASDDVLMSCYNFLNTYDDGFKRYGDVVIGIKKVSAQYFGVNRSTMVWVKKNEAGSY